MIETRAVVQVPAFEEGPSMLGVLDEIRAQEVPPGVSVDNEVWVTLSPPDKELCDTWQSAVQARGFDVYEAPLGKLSARNAAHNHAVDAGYDIIISCDADAQPLDSDAFADLLDPLVNRGFSCSNSRPVASPTGALGRVVDVVGGLEDAVLPHIHGQLHAFTTRAWEIAGPFDTSIDQTDIEAVRAEEEFLFRRRLDQVDRGVVDVHDARVFNDPRRHYCRIPGTEQSEYCERRGQKTFSPRLRRE
jgi:hypothetical protein